MRTGNAENQNREIVHTGIRRIVFAVAILQDSLCSFIHKVSGAKRKNRYENHMESFYTGETGDIIAVFGPEFVLWKKSNGNSTVFA